MKIQDITFFVILAGLFWFKRPVLFVWSGLASILLSVPLFGFWIFFTAERLTWYAAAFFLVYIVLQLLGAKSDNTDIRINTNDSNRK